MTSSRHRGGAANAGAVAGVFALALTAAIANAAPRHELSAKAGLDSAYDDNVFNGRGPDFVNRVAPSGRYALIDPRVKFDISYAAGIWTYALGKAETSVNHRAALGLEGNPTRRLFMRVADEFVRAEDPGFLTRAGVVAPQIGIFDNILESTIGYRLARPVYGALGYMFHLASFDQYTAEQIAAGLPRLYDGAEHNVSGHLDWRILRNDDIRFNGRVQLFSAGPQADSPFRWNLALSYSPTVGWRHIFLRPLEWTADAGPIFYQSLDGAANIPGAPQESGVTWRFASRLRFRTESWLATLSYVRDLVGATGAGTALWADAVNAQVGYIWRQRVDAIVGAGYFRNGRAVDQDYAYQGATATALLDVRVVDNFHIGAYYTLRYQIAGPGATPPGMTIAMFPDVIRNVVGLRLLAVIGADARPPRREVRE